MEPRPGDGRIGPGWWAAILVAAMITFVVLSSAIYDRAFTPYVPVTLTSERAGLMMEPGGQVKMRGVEIGRVGSVSLGGRQSVRIKLEIDPSQIQHIPANVEAKIAASTAFGAKYVELSPPEHPSSQRITAGAVLQSRNVSVEVNTVFDNLVTLLNQVDPAKLNAVLTTLADGLRGRGNQLGEATTAANNVLTKLNSRSDALRSDWQAVAGFSDSYSAAAKNILVTLDAVSTTSTTITDHATALDSLLLNVIGLADTGTGLLAPNKDTLVTAINTAEPTTNLLLQYNPEYTCLLVGSKWYLDHGGYAATGGNGHSSILDTGLLLGNDPYAYPDNLPIVAAKGGPGGKPSCGSLPDASKNFPVRQLVTNTGWGTGMDIRPNIGLGHPCYANYLPVTRAVPEPPSVRCQGPPSPGLVLPAQPPAPAASPDPPPPPPAEPAPLDAPPGPPSP